MTRTGVETGSVGMEPEGRNAPKHLKAGSVEGLVEKLEAAEVGSRALDGYLCAELAQQPEWAKKNHAPRQPELWTDGGPGARAREWTCPRYTTSLDAALALAERLGIDPSTIVNEAEEATSRRGWAEGRYVSAFTLNACIAILKARLSLTLEGEG